MTETISVFIDGDNVSFEHLDRIMTEIKEYGRIILCKVYADWSENNCIGWRLAAKNNGIESIQADRINGKNSTDIKMTVDIMNTLYDTKHVTLFYLVTSDSDYRHVIPQIKLQNKKVHCIGSSTANNSCSLIGVVVLLVVERVVDVSATGAGNGVASSEVHEVIKTNISKLVSFLFIAYKITTILIY